MKLKKYIQFIKESIKEDIEEQSIWKILADLHSAGILIDEEFSEKKSELLSKI